MRALYLQGTCLLFRMLCIRKSKQVPFGGTLNKHNLINAICEKLEADLIILKDAAKATYDAATNEESKPENEYDTRALEASYLAGAQAKRVGEIEELLFLFKNLNLKSFSNSDSIMSTALVEVELENKKSFVFLMSKGGGMQFVIDSIAIQIITPHSPLGEALLGLKVGDTAVVESAKKILEYDVISIQ